MNRNQKQELVSALRSLFREAAVVVVVYYKGMTVAEMNTLRVEIREAGARFVVTKNKLTRLALAETSYECLIPLFVGQTAIACSYEPVAAAKVTARYAKRNDKLVIIGGGLSMGRLLNPDRILTLAELPPLNELRAGLVSIIQTPAAHIAGLLQVSARQLARLLKVYADKSVNDESVNKELE